MSCKQKHDLVCAQLRIIRGNPLANTFLFFISLYLSSSRFFSFSFFDTQKYIRSYSRYNETDTQIYLLFYSYYDHPLLRRSSYSFIHFPFFLFFFFREMKLLLILLSFFLNLSDESIESSSVRRPSLIIIRDATVGAKIVNSPCSGLDRFE